MLFCSIANHKLIPFSPRTKFTARPLQVATVPLTIRSTMRMIFGPHLKLPRETSQFCLEVLPKHRYLVRIELGAQQTVGLFGKEVFSMLQRLERWWLRGGRISLHGARTIADKTEKTPVMAFRKVCARGHGECSYYAEGT